MQFTAPYSLVCDSNLAVHFHSSHLADLRASGLIDDTIRRSGVYSIRPCDLSHFFNLRIGVPSSIQSALCFPYQGGEFARIKLFPAIGKRKYSQPPGTSARLYVPFPVEDGPIIVAEGEKKMLAAHQAGLNAVGIGGVWSWSTDGEPISDLDLIDWDGREVTIIPDSDVWHRSDLLRAIYALGRELQLHGAQVLIAEIAQDGAAKVGLDDYLVAGGNVANLEIYALSHRVFKNAGYWHSKWKFKRATKAA